MQKLDEIKTNKRKLYEDFKAGRVSQAAFEILRALLNSRVKRLKNREVYQGLTSGDPARVKAAQRQCDRWFGGAKVGANT